MYIYFSQTFNPKIFSLWKKTESDPDVFFFFIVFFFFLYSYFLIAWLHGMNPGFYSILLVFYNPTDSGSFADALFWKWLQEIHTSHVYMTQNKYNEY